MSLLLREIAPCLASEINTNIPAAGNLALSARNDLLSKLEGCNPPTILFLDTTLCFSWIPTIGVQNITASVKVAPLAFKNAIDLAFFGTL